MTFTFFWDLEILPPLSSSGSSFVAPYYYCFHLFFPLSLSLSLSLQFTLLLFSSTLPSIFVLRLQRSFLSQSGMLSDSRFLPFLFAP
ncbi:hypothetical protein RJT34_26902 [Clitoria ternatea]|uniref:Uncharacterized protein n=1 Tax=Clitoria ternatea TaxID=43366 RepID=A0AAN9F7Q0_CLITE